MNDDLVGQVVTVLGPVPADELGVILPHEHVIKDSSDRFPLPAGEEERAAFLAPLTLDNLHRVTYGNFGAVADNTRLTDEEVAVAELRRFREAGGGTICDLTSGGMNGDPQALARVAAASNVHIVQGCGWYLGKFHPPRVARMTERELALEMVDSVRFGVDDTGVRAGVIGEIGCSWPLGDTEEKVLRAAVLAQQETGVGLFVHPSPNEQSPPQIIEILGEMEARLERVVICHMDRCGYELDTRLQILESGCFVEYDTFGYSVHPILAATREGALPSMLNDVARVRQIIDLVDRGFVDQLLVSHDTAFKHALTRWGGQGYGHLLANVTPYFELYGLDRAQIERLYTANPRRLLAIG